MGSSAGLCRVGPAKVKASKCILFTEDSPEVEIKNTCLVNSSYKGTFMFRTGRKIP